MFNFIKKIFKRDKKEEEIVVSEPINEEITESDSEKLVKSRDIEAIKGDIKEQTIGEYKKRAKIKKRKMQEERRIAVFDLADVNNDFMKDYYGITPTRRMVLGFPGFMSLNFTGMMVGRRLEDGKLIIFTGPSEFLKRNFRFIDGRYPKFARLGEYSKSGEPYGGYLWFRIGDKGVLRELLDNEEFVDAESRVNLETFFAYIDYVKGWRQRNPDVKLKLSEIVLE